MSAPRPRPPDWLEVDGWVYARVHRDTPQLVEMLAEAHGESAYDTVTSAIVRAWAALPDRLLGRA